MPDLTESLLPEFKQHRLDGIDFGDEFQYPMYDGGSIFNLPPTICQLFDIPGLGSGDVLRPNILTPLIDSAGAPRRIILILMDALALHRLRRWMADGEAPFWSRLVSDGLFAPLTSVVPSTTSTALPSIWSGLSPAEHAMVGYELWLKEYGVVANMILHSPF